MTSIDMSTKNLRSNSVLQPAVILRTPLIFVLLIFLQVFITKDRVSFANMLSINSELTSFDTKLNQVHLTNKIVINYKNITIQADYANIILKNINTSSFYNNNSSSSDLGNQAKHHAVDNIKNNKRIQHNQQTANKHHGAEKVDDKIDKIILKGSPILFYQIENNFKLTIIKGNIAEYYPNDHIIKLFDNVSIKQDNRYILADIMIYNMQNQHYQIFSNNYSLKFIKRLKSPDGLSSTYNYTQNIYNYFNNQHIWQYYFMLFHNNNSTRYNLAHKDRVLISIAY